MPDKKEDTRSQSQKDRDEELARQKAVNDAVAAHDKASYDAAQKALAKAVEDSK